jgi:hypothetical protein
VVCGSGWALLAVAQTVLGMPVWPPVARDASRHVKSVLSGDSNDYDDYCAARTAAEVLNRR